MDVHQVIRRSGTAFALLTIAASPLSAQQQQSYEPPAHVAFVDGVAAHVREGRSQSPTPGALYLPGDRLRSAEGRLEVLFPDGTALHLDEFTEVDLLSPTLMRLNSGRLLLIVSGVERPSQVVGYQVDTVAGSSTTGAAGEYRFSLRPSAAGPELEFAVLRGAGLLANEEGATELYAGERSNAREGLRPSGPSRFNVARFDAFDRWSQVRRDSRLIDATTGDFLPGQVRSYAPVFDRYGSWAYEPEYGKVWYPRVSADWRPYYNGYWEQYAAYGWTWIASDPWGWPTHHYGRWGYGGSRWFWIPGSQWAPAWVSWASAPGYVAWCPLGFYNSPVFSLSVGFSTWGGWVATPATYFSASVGWGPVHRYAVAPHRLPAPTSFASHRTAPIDAPRPVPRAGVAGGAPGGGRVAPAPAPLPGQSAPHTSLPGRGGLAARGGAPSGSTAATVTRQPFTPSRNPSASARMPVARVGTYASRPAPTPDQAGTTPRTPASPSGLQRAVPQGSVRPPTSVSLQSAASESAPAVRPPTVTRRPAPTNTSGLSPSSRLQVPSRAPGAPPSAAALAPQAPTAPAARTPVSTFRSSGGSSGAQAPRAVRPAPAPAPSHGSTSARSALAPARGGSPSGGSAPAGSAAAPSSSSSHGSSTGSAPARGGGSASGSGRPVHRR
jgi:hypothetical protein